MKATLTAIFSLLSGLNPVITAMVTVIVTVTGFFTWINSQWTVLLAKMDMMTQANFAGVLSLSPIGLINTFFPLSETLTFFSAWLGLVVVASTIRIVKSFIPTVAT
jgi:hypothetical protein